MPVVRRDVTSLSKSGSAKLKGDVTLSEGTGVTLTQSGQDISIAASGGGTGDVVGPASATDEAIARFDTTTGKLIQNSNVTISDGGNITIAESVSGGSTREIRAANRTDSNAGDGIAFYAGSANTGDVPGGSVFFGAGDGAGTGAGGNITFDAGNGSTTDGTYQFRKPGSLSDLIFDLANLTADRTLTFPDATGTLQLQPSEGGFVNGDKTKLDGIEAGAEVNNISDVNATDLTDAGDSALHFHSADRARANHTGTQALSTISDVTASAAEVNILDGATLSTTELNYVDGVTSAIQTQLDAKATSTDLSNHIADTTTHGTTGDIVGTSDSQTLTNKTLTAPRISGILDTNGNESIDLPATASAVNQITIQNSATGNSPAIYPSGGDTNANLLLYGKGTGSVRVNDSRVVTETETQTLTNKTLTSPAITTPTGIVKGDVGLGNVDNTSDATKNSASATLTNKTIDGDDNTIQDLGTSSLKDDAVTAAKMQYGTFRARQGGTSGDASWYSSGTTNTDTSAKAVFIQGGRIATSAAGDTTITFPNAYTYAPLVIATTSSAGGANSFAIVVGTTTTTATVRTINDSGSRVAENLNWVAYGQ